MGRPFQLPHYRLQLPQFFLAFLPPILVPIRVILTKKRDFGAPTLSEAERAKRGGPKIAAAPPPGGDASDGVGRGQEAIDTGGDITYS